MASRASVVLNEQGSVAATPKVRRDALRAGLEVVARLWHERYKMLKFSNAASRRYNLKPRMGEPGSGRKFKGSYTEAKLKRKANGQGVRAIGETKPFVWSGNSRERARSANKVNAKAASASRGYAESIVDVPTLNLRPKNGRIRLREEFEQVIEEERRALEIEGIKVYQAEVEKSPLVRREI